MNKKTICNIALLKIGLRPIKSFNDNMREAKLGKAIYDFLKTELLTSYHWKFTNVDDTGEITAKESDFPAVFKSAFISLLCAEFALSILDDERKYHLYKRLFYKQLSIAKLQDAKGYNKGKNYFPLIAARN